MKQRATERKFFPDPRRTLADGLVMVGGQLSIENLVEAYSFGIFPWPQEGLPVLWFCPKRRGILEFKKIKWPRSFLKFQRKTQWRVTKNEDFASVIRACAKVARPGQRGTWITPAMIDAYIEFHKAGYAHSYECWDKDRLVGGLYGVEIGNLFSGESMFHLAPNASKMCLWQLTEDLKAKGQTWMDIQMVTELPKSLGGRYISRELFLKWIAKTI